MLAHPKPPKGAANLVRAKIVEAVFVGDHFEYKAEVGNEIMPLSLPSTTPYAEDDTIFLELPEASVVIWAAAAKDVLKNLPGD
jgi:hypothetical protein